MSQNGKKKSPVADKKQATTKQKLSSMSDRLKKDESIIRKKTGK